jgi:dihydropteroate synthase
MKQQLICSSKKLDLARAPLLMGILNVTPDSFSDGGRYLKPQDAVDHALRMIDEGAHLIDIGGESTRPGSKPVPVDQQKKRVLPVIESLVKKNKKIVLSIDTQDSQVAGAALAAGASIVNDISALQNDPEMAAVCAKHKAAVVLMHMQNKPETMQENPRYVDIVSEVKTFLQSRIEAAEKAGIASESIVVDVGIGFGKSVNHNLVLVREMSQFHALRKPLLAGLSRKSFIGKVLEIDDPAERVIGTAAATAWCVAGNVQILRVHDVKEMKQVAQIIRAIGTGRV